MRLILTILLLALPVFAQGPSADVLQRITDQVAQAQAVVLDPHNVFGQGGGTLVQSLGEALDFPGGIAVTWRKDGGLDYGGASVVEFGILWFNVTDWLSLEAGPFMGAMFGNKRTDILGGIGVCTRFPAIDKVTTWWQASPMSEWPFLHKVDISTAKAFIGVGSNQKFDTVGIFAGASVKL